MEPKIVARERRYLLFTEAPPLEKTREFVSGHVANGSSQFYAVCGTDVVGRCDVICHERVVMTHSGHLEIGVTPTRRGKGIGRRLVKETGEDCFSKWLQRIELEVFASINRTVQIHLKFGFVEEGRKPKARFIDGDYDDFIIMGLPRDTPDQVVEPTSLRSTAHD